MDYLPLFSSWKVLEDAIIRAVKYFEKIGKTWAEQVKAERI